MKRALITGITGQDGSYLAELLLEKGYHVVGMVRRSSNNRFDRIEHILDRLEICSGDLHDQDSLSQIMIKHKPDEIYNLAAQSFVQTSFDQAVMTGDITGLGVTRMLNAVRAYVPTARFYQASSSEMFGKVVETPQRETTPFWPRSPYGVAKAYGHYLVQNYRESYDMFACSGILFNHESPRRGPEFVTRKISLSVARIAHGLDSELRLGNLDASRDWGHAKDYVEAMWLMLQAEKPDDYVVGTGETHTVREFVQLAFDRVGLNWEKYVKIDPKFFRPAEVDLLLSDPARAKAQLKWSPKTSFTQLVQQMVDSDMTQIERLCRLNGAA